MFELAGLNQRIIEIIAGPIAAIRCHNNQVVLIDQAEEQHFSGVLVSQPRKSLEPPWSRYRTGNGCLTFLKRSGSTTAALKVRFMLALATFSESTFAAKGAIDSRYKKAKSAII